jgi:uncharacterized protein
MSGIGFGLERIGLVALRRPILFSVVVLVLTAIAAINVAAVRFNGDITAILPEETESYRDYFQQKAEFSDAARDVTILVRSDRLMTAEGLEDLRYLHLELAINTFVGKVVSLFSVPEIDEQTGEFTQFFPPEFESDEQARQLVDELIARYPQAARLIAPDAGIATIVVSLEASMLDGEQSSYANFRALRDAARRAVPDDFEVMFTGITPIGATVVTALVTDQLRLTSIGLALGTALAFYIFRSFLAALICALPPAFTALWSLGLLGYFQIPITYLTTVLPTLALILAFADGIVLYFRWQAGNGQNPDLLGNLADAIRRIGPASALTSITTLLAFLSFSIAPGSALKEFSVLGMTVVALAFFSVILVLPLAGYWSVKAGLLKPGKARRPAFSDIGRPIWRFVSAYPRQISWFAVLAVVLLASAHMLVTPEFRITDYMPKDSETRRAEELVNQMIGGRSPIFVTAPKAVPGPALLPQNRARLAEIRSVLEESFDEKQIFSADKLADAMHGSSAIEGFDQQFETAAAQNGYVSKDGTRMLIAVYQPSNRPVERTMAEVRDVRSGLAAYPWGQAAVVTGFDVLMADEFTALIEQLRNSLLIAIFLGVAIVGIATRSPLLAVAALTPNLLPILFVELVVWLKGGTVNLSEVIALTISFGIAIDNAVHVINLYNSRRKEGAQVRQAIGDAIEEVAPALAASTAIICVSCLVTLLSTLPMVPVLGRLMIATLLVAYISNLAILPANMLSLRWFGLGAGTEPEPTGARTGRK